MEMMAMVSSVLAMQSAATQGQIATTLMKQNLNAQKNTVLTLLGQPSQANLGAGIGGSLDKLA